MFGSKVRAPREQDISHTEYVAELSFLNRYFL